MYALRRITYNTFKAVLNCNKGVLVTCCSSSSNIDQPKYSPRMAEFKKRLEEEEFYPVEKPANRGITPIRYLDQKNVHNMVVKEFEYKPFPNNTNPVTGEVGGPRGPEPTRYGDWERKGRCTDF